MELESSPVRGFKASSDYKIILTKALLQHTKGKSLPDKDEFSFHTPYLKLESAEWFLGEICNGRR